MTEKTLQKIETRDSEAREEIENILKENEYKVCPYVVRIYDYMAIGGNGGKQIAVQCLYSGTVHKPRESCLADFGECKKYKELKEHDDWMKR